MTVLVLDPHGDDAALFAAFTCLREKPHVIVTHPTVPRSEILGALSELDCTSEIYLDSPDALEHYLRHSFFPTTVYAPALAEEGHEDHNAIARLAHDVYGSRVIPYLTYAPRGARLCYGVEVEPEPTMIGRKLRALSCFQSQIESPLTRPWFYDLLDLREWVLA